MEAIKVGFCVAYDWHLLAFSLPRIYEFADLICISVDKDRISWSGNSYAFNDGAFHDLINTIDYMGKVKLIEENYHLPDLTPMQNEVRQRNMLAGHMGKGGWHIQLDSDEYFVDFGGFVHYLQSLSKWKISKTNICCPWLVIFKRLDDGFLCIDPVDNARVEYMQIASKDPIYEYGRRNGNFNLYTNYLIAHQSWAREEQEIKEKIYNWGHSEDFNKEAYYTFWKGVNKTNFQDVRDFHWLKPSAWPRLVYVQFDSIETLFLGIHSIDFPILSLVELSLKNSKTVSRFKKIWKILKGKAHDH